ncbi:hypothetical protein KO116_01441 [Halomonas sp. KO116]|nr:hypothetical protein KO116_01441 [Halomonas sp. KO116]
MASTAQAGNALAAVIAPLIKRDGISDTPLPGRVITLFKPPSGTDPASV